MDRGHFGTDHLVEGLGRRALRAGSLSGSGQAGQFLVLSVTTIILARLLTPEDYGLVAMVTAVTSFVAGFKDLGLAASTVQRLEINHAQTSALFWLNVAFGMLFAMVVSASAPGLAWFYQEPRVAWVTVAMASTFIFSGLATQHHSLLRRQLRFGEIAGIEFVATLLAAMAAIVAALRGAEYWSLVLMHALTSLLTMAGVWVRCSWRPGKPARAAGVREMLSYGGYLTGFNIVSSFLRSFDRVLIGWSAAAGPLGLYSRASFLVLIPTVRFSGAATAVALPVLSRLQNDPARYRAFILMATLLFGGVSIPLGFFAFAAADPIVLALLGPQWGGTAPILRALAPIAALAALEAATLWVTASTGNTRRQFMLGVTTTVVAVIAMSVGIRWGVVGVAIGFTIAQTVACTVGLAYCLQPLSFKAADFFVVLWRPAAAAAVAAVVIVVANRTVLADRGAVLILVVDLCAFVVSYGLCWWVLPNGRATIREMMALAGSLRRSSADRQ